MAPLRIKQERIHCKKPGNKNVASVYNENNGLDKKAANKRDDHIRDIRQKIKKGFYNTDSVLEDISHGFAKALDQAL